MLEVRNNLNFPLPNLQDLSIIQQISINLIRFETLNAPHRLWQNTPDFALDPSPFASPRRSSNLLLLRLRLVIVAINLQVLRVPLPRPPNPPLLISLPSYYTPTNVVLRTPNQTPICKGFELSLLIWLRDEEAGTLEHVNSQEVKVRRLDHCQRGGRRWRC